MPNIRKRPRPRPETGNRSVAHCSAFEHPLREGRLELIHPDFEENDSQKKESFKKARYWFREQGFVQSILRQRYAFYNYGFTVNGKAVREWEVGQASSLSPGRNGNGSNKHSRQAGSLSHYCRDAWSEWLKLDNVIALWREHGQVLTKAPEDVTFTDAYGEEMLCFRHGLTHEQINALPGLSTAERDRLRASSELKLTHADTMWHFEVLKRERLGYGLASTGLRPIFTAAAQHESLEVSDAGLAAACRRIYEQHLIGHEIKSGPHAGSKVHFLKKGTADLVTKNLKGKTGHQTLLTNFDHKILIGAGLPDPRQFAGTRYDAIFDRLLMWAMPLGHILLMKSINPYLMGMLRVQAMTEREYMAGHLETVFRRALKQEVKLAWSNECFEDPRIFAELFKAGFAGGPVSQETMLEKLGLKAETERTRKATEADLPDGQVIPRFDAAHGPVKPKKPTGRPAGVSDA